MPNRMRRGRDGRGRRPLVSLLSASLMSLALLAGCAEAGDDATQTQIVSSTTPKRVVMQIINNVCGTADEDDTEEEISTGQVKGLSKVLNGFGIPYDERNPNYSGVPKPITDDSYEANKDRGIGYAGLESHYPGEIKGGWRNHKLDGSKSNGSYCLNKTGQAYFNDETASFSGWEGLSDSQKDAYVYQSEIWHDLTPEEELYGCCMRWEYAGWPRGNGIPGYLNFVTGSEGHRQYVAIHALKTDKWVIACPFDFGPGTNLPIAGSENYGRIGGVSPEVADALGFGGHGEAPDIALTEWWWVDNSDQVSVGPVGDLSQFENGGSSSSSSSGTSSGAAASVNIATSVASSVANEIARNSSAGDNAAVTVAPANPNSFIADYYQSAVTGSVQKSDLASIVLHDQPTDIEQATQGCLETNYSIGEDGTITIHAGIGSTTAHTGDPSVDGTSISIGLVRKSVSGEYKRAQLNALDRLVAYIDQDVGRQLPITCHDEMTKNGTFPTEQYAASRNHAGVSNVEDVRKAAESGKCDDGTEVEDEAAGGAGIAAKAVEMAGTATPKDAIPGGWNEKPTDTRLSAYVTEKDRVYPDVSGWADCGRFAATAVKASGADETFPANRDTAYQYSYMTANSKWQRVGTLRNGDSPDELCHPGDILVTEGKGHIMVYAGTEAVQVKFPASQANMVEASMGKYYGWCYERDYHMGPNYAIFRCTKPDNAPEYKWSDTDSNSGGGVSQAMSGARAAIVAYCRRNIGASYDYMPSGGVEGKSYNCSFLSTCAYKAAGLSIPHWQNHQNGNGSQTDAVRAAGHWTTDTSKLEPGDLVFFGSSPDNTGHVGISLGGNKMIDSVPDGGVQERTLYGTFVGGGWPFKELPAGSAVASDATSSKSMKSSKSSKVTTTGVGAQVAWLAVQMAPVAGDLESPITEPSANPWNKVSDPRLDNLYAIMDAEKELCPEFNCAYASCCQAAVGAFAAVMDMDALPGGAASGNPKFCMWYLANHPDLYEKIDATSMDDFEPGDIFVTSTLRDGRKVSQLSRAEMEGIPDSECRTFHVAIYVGNEMAQKKFPGTTGNVYQAGYSAGHHAKYPSIDTYDFGAYTYLEMECYRPLKHNDDAALDDIDWQNLVDAAFPCPDAKQEMEINRITVNVTRA